MTRSVMEPTVHSPALLGTMAGTLLTIAVNASSEDYLRTVVLGAVGAVSSFIVSALLRWVLRFLRPRQ